MKRILSTGTAFNIATTTGDAGQLGMVAEFSGYFSGLIGRLIHPIIGGFLGDRAGIGLSRETALKGDRLGRDLVLWFRPFLRLAGWFSPTNWDHCPDLGDYARRRYLHYFFQHSVSQH